MKVRRIEGAFWTIESNGSIKATPVIIATDDIINSIEKDRTLQQLINVCNLDSVCSPVVLMPDAHEGYGFPIGAVAAFPYERGIISPGGIGYDINCGVRLLRTPFVYADVKKVIDKLINGLYNEVPSGVGRGGHYNFSAKELDKFAERGAQEAVRRDLGFPEDLSNIESNGKISDANPYYVSNKAKERGKDQLGTMGAGNHFVEVNIVEKIFDKEKAELLGLFKDEVCVLIHTGSRGYGHQVATDYISLFLSKKRAWGIELRDKELAYAPLEVEEAKRYWGAMNAAANFAFANRQIITHLVRNVFKKVMGVSTQEIKVVYDVAHNIAKLEKHKIGGKDMKVIVHRKGATRAFGPSHLELSEKFKKTGQPVLIPGSMGTASYVLCGTDKSMEVALGSCCHGAGRLLSRAQAVKTFSQGNLKKELKERDIHIAAGSVRGLLEEAPQAYKNVDEVVKAVELAGIAKIVAKLKPIGVIKG